MSARAPDGLRRLTTGDWISVGVEHGLLLGMSYGVLVMVIVAVHNGAAVMFIIFGPIAAGAGCVVGMIGGALVGGLAALTSSTPRGRRSSPTAIAAIVVVVLTLGLVPILSLASWSEVDLLVYLAGPAAYTLASLAIWPILPRSSPFGSGGTRDRSQ